MKVYLDEDEWYPVYSVVDASSFCTETIELTEKELKEFSKVYGKFNEWQKRIRLKVLEARNDERSNS